MKEELGSSKYENECIFKDFNYEDFKKNFKVHKRQVYFLKICTIVGRWDRSGGSCENLVGTPVFQVLLLELCTNLCNEKQI